MECDLLKIDPPRIPNKDDLVACLFCTEIVPLKSNKRLPNFWLKVSIFCQAVELPRDSFENGFKFSPFCTDCIETIVAVASIQKSIDELEVKLDLYKEKIINLLKRDYHIERVEEAKVNAFKNFSPSKFRERIREQLRINPSEKFPNDLDQQPAISEFLQTVYSPDNTPTVLESNVPDPTFEVCCNLFPSTASSAVEKSQGEPSQVNSESSSQSQALPKRNESKTGKESHKVLASTRLEKICSRKKVSRNVEETEDLAEDVDEADGTHKKNQETLSTHEGNQSEETKKCSGGRRYYNPNLVVKCTHIDPLKGPCNRKFETEEKMNIHIRRYHLKVPKNDLIQCPHCPRTMSNMTRLAEHMKLHTGETDLPCDICGMLFRTEYLIVKHKVRAHGQPFPNVCQYCNEGFFTKAELKYHSYSHTGQWPYPCDECDAGFPSKARLERHRQYNHYDALYICKVCNRKYQSAAILTKHEKSHEVGKRFKCETCGWSFRFQSALKSHIHSVHTDNRPFLCQECGAAFKLNKHLLVHLKGHDHRKRPFLKRNRKIRTPSTTAISSAPPVSD
ncbi:unnamed protein product [Allacma fusca]|uniref:C2H2-type domain-containing protein n=1 Tax=Allacma fusca TaxID=39272 RepID=A0A8J2KPY3_9HEXA|nr:unnamed protein product [Allacma fusca]